MISDRNFFCLSEISKLEFDNLREDIDCLDSLNTGHQHINIKLSASLATSLRRPVTEKAVEILENALRNLTLNE